jgi:hypothetical protein
MCAAVARPDPFSRNHLIPEPVFALVTSHEHEPGRRFPCPFLAGEVELTAEREAHILERHPELCVVLFQRLRETLHAPMQSGRVDARRTRWSSCGGILCFPSGNGSWSS